jgi:hypothetical protein
MEIRKKNNKTACLQSKLPDYAMIGMSSSIGNRKRMKETEHDEFTEIRPRNQG